MNGLGLIVLIGLVIGSGIFIIFTKNKKIAIGISLVIIGLQVWYVTNVCGPNSKDVKVMKPMAQKIADYIVLNGIPQSLKDIPDLPYEVEGCHELVKNDEECSFYKDKDKYDLELLLKLYRESTECAIYAYSHKTQTHLRFELKKDSQQWKLGEIHEYSSKTSGICNPMRQ